MSTPDTRVVTASDGTPLHATVVNGTGPTVVLAHGWALSAHSWAPVRRMLHLLGPVRTVSYDQRHHGRSGRGGTPLSIDLLGDDLRQVLDQLVPAGPVILAGHSMGGMSIMALAATTDLVAARVSGVALVSTSAGGLRPRRDPARLLALAARGHALVDPVRRLVGPALPPHRLLVRRLLLGTGAAPEVVRATADEIAATPVRTIGEFWPVLCAHDKTAALTRLSAVPVEVVVGSRDRLTPVSHARLLAERIDGARLTVLPGLGHMLAGEHPELLARTLLRLAAGAPDSPEVTP